MRERMSALIGAFRAPEEDARLRDRWGVTHMLVRPRAMLGPAPPRYFEPFDRMAAAEWARWSESPAWTRHPEAVVYRDEDHLLLALHEIDSPLGAEGLDSAAGAPGR